MNDHFVEITEMIELGKGALRAVKTVLMSRYACYLVIQNADPAKQIVALGQTYFAVQLVPPKTLPMSPRPAAGSETAIN